jgi:TOMM system kinase/cyclase fusion protein
MAKFNEPQDPSDAETVIGESVTSTSPARPPRSKTGLPDNLPRLGARFGGDDGARFELVEMLGRGGMGTVFLARDRLLERPVAVKFIIHPEYYLPQDERVALFKQEARATARLNHEGIVRVFDLGTYLRMPFLVMEYLEGQALSSIMKHQRLDALRATRIMADVARGLAHAHRTGIVHRDLKPSNIFIVKDSRAKILDFGLATVVRGPGSTQRSAQANVSVVAGTPRYMSPEQWRGEPQDGRTDLWALGMIFFELLTGRTPVESKKIAAIRDGTISDRPLPSVRQLRPDLPLEADALVSRALSKDVAERFVTADEFLDAIVGLEVVLSRILRTSSQATIGEATRAVITQRRVSLVSFGLSNLATLSAELDLENVSEILANYFDIGRTVVRQLEGTLVSSAGGRMLACFGYPVAHEDSAQRAVRAAFLVSEAVQGLRKHSSANLALKIGIHTGTVLVGGGLDSGEPPVLQGEAPELTSWIERQARPGQILISATTAASTSWLLELESLGLHTPEGSAHSIETFRVVGQTPAMSRFDQSARAGLTPMVGREREMMALRKLWTEAEAGRGQFAIVSGEAGIGKSRLTQSLKEHIGQQTSTQLTGQCWSYFQHAAFHPLIEVADCAIGTSGNDSAAVKLSKLEALLERLQLDPGEHSALLASFLSIPASGAVRPIALSPDMLRLRFIDSLTALIIRLAAEGPTLLLIEDGHWSDASTQDLLTALLDRMVGARLLVVVTCRPQSAPAFPNRAHLHQLQLDRLPPEATAALVANASRGRVLPADMVSALVERADGIPLFVEELTRMMVDTWRLEEASEAPRIDNQAIVRSIPQTLNELLVARLDQLPGTGKEVAQLGAVLGREFSFDLIDRCSHVERDRLRGGLMQLVDADLIRHQESPAGARYAFKHALVQDAAYHSLLRSQRRVHHQRVAETLEREFGELAEQQPELLAHHFLEAGAALKALPYLERAGQRAVQRSAHSDAITHYRTAIDLVAAGEDSADLARKELSLRLALGAPLMAKKGYAHADVEANYARALELSRGLGDDSQVFLSTLGLWQFSLVGGRIALGVELGGQLMAQAQAARDDVSIMLAHRSLATSLMLSADLERACEHTAAGLKLYDPEKHGKLGFKFGHDPGVVHGLYRAIILWLLGRGDEALEASSNALTLSEELKHPMSIAFALCYSGVVENMRGEYAQARRHATAGRDLSADHQLALWLAMNTIVIGWADCGLGEPRGNDIMADGIAALIRTGAKASLTLFDSAQAWGLLRMGRHEEALRVVNRAQALVHQTGEVFYKAELSRLNGEALLSESSTETHESERCFREALEVARQQKARAFELRAAVSLARLLVKTGRPADALATLEPVHGQFRQGFNTADLVAANELIGKLQTA